MKKVLISLLILALLLAGCGTDPQVQHTPEATAAPTVEPTAAPKPVITAEQADYLTETWVAVEIPFETTTNFAKAPGEGGSAASKVGKLITSLAAEVKLDVEFTNRETGTKLVIPGFWNGAKKFAVRFAPTEYGIWDYQTVCDDAPLNGLTGTVGANAYTGDLAIYQHGFVTTKYKQKYFTYDDGTPFFYLGDTHWNLYSEEYNGKGAHAGDIDTKSHFKYIVDKRVEQGFTVYQSEPLGAQFNLTDGLTGTDISGFKEMDKYFQYIAEKGLVHANAEFFFASSMSELIVEHQEYLELISRYWVARFGAYPVMWTLGQEIDNDLYFERDDNNSHPWWNYTANPWVKAAEYIHKYDAYAHPLSAHQENTGSTTASGNGKLLNQSAFYSEEVTQKTGHDWYAAQWSPSLTSFPDSRVTKDYWSTDKVCVNYESRYCYLWTKDFGARAQGWISYLSGFFGYGYGAEDIWLYKSTYDINTTSNDGKEKITPEDKAIQWHDSVEFESAYQVGYMRAFFEDMEWWRLVPTFNDNTHVRDAGSAFVCASIGTEVYVIYYYGVSIVTGVALGIDDKANYEVLWFNPRTNEAVPVNQKLINDSTLKDGTKCCKLPNKPDNNDWILKITKQQ